MKARWTTHIPCLTCVDRTPYVYSDTAPEGDSQATADAIRLGWVELPGREIPHRPRNWICRSCAEDIRQVLAQLEGAPAT